MKIKDVLYMAFTLAIFLFCTCVSPADVYSGGEILKQAGSNEDTDESTRWVALENTIYTLDEMEIGANSYIYF